MEEEELIRFCEAGNRCGGKNGCPLGSRGDPNLIAAVGGTIRYILQNEKPNHPFVPFAGASKSLRRNMDHPTSTDIAVVAAAARKIVVEKVCEMYSPYFEDGNTDA
jgi:hypothetical protein